MWCAFAPACPETCSVIPPCVAKPWKNSRTSSVSKLPIFCAGRVISHTRDDAGDRLVQRDPSVGEAPDAALVAQRLRQRPAQRDAGILDRVVIVDVTVAGGAHGHVDQRVAGQLIQHVVEKAHAGAVVVGARPVEIDLDGDVGLGGLAMDAGTAHGRILWLRPAL